jgi:hypothetical protein
MERAAAAVRPVRTELAGMAGLPVRVFKTAAAAVGAMAAVVTERILLRMVAVTAARLKIVRQAGWVVCQTFQFALLDHMDRAAVVLLTLVSAIWGQRALVVPGLILMPPTVPAVAVAAAPVRPLSLTPQVGTAATMEQAAVAVGSPGLPMRAGQEQMA